MLNTMKKSFFILTLTVIVCTSLLSGCDALTGKEIGRIPVNQISTDSNLIIKETSLDLKSGEKISIWSDMDMEYEGNAELRFRMQLLKDGENLGNLEIDPTEKNITLGEVKTTLMGKTNWSFAGKNSEITIDGDGKYTFKAILVSSENPTLKIMKAEIVLKK
jgi:hypothetical protein